MSFDTVQDDNDDKCQPGERTTAKSQMMLTAEKCTQSLNSAKLVIFSSCHGGSVGRALGTRENSTARLVVRIPGRERCQIFVGFRSSQQLWGNLSHP